MHALRFRMPPTIPFVALLLALALTVSIPIGPAQADQSESGANPIAAASVAVGTDHSCVVTKQKTVRCWGDSSDGQLGYGNEDTIGDNETPASAGDVPLGGEAVAVGAGASHTCALLTTGAVRCWGFAGEGALGYGNEDTIGDDETPASAGDVPLGGVAVSISVNGSHTCAVLEGGTVTCWGDGTSGQLGYGSTNDIGDDETPASVGPVPIGAATIAVAAGAAHTCVLLATGAVRCWGHAGSGRSGYGNTTNNNNAATATDVPIGGTVDALSAGGVHTCALLSGGSVRCWGLGNGGRLGYGDTLNVGDGVNPGKETPEDAGDVPLGGTASGVIAGGSTTCAVLTTGSMRCWGSGGDGRNGYGNTLAVGSGENPGYETPADAGDINLGGVALAGQSWSHTCAVLTDASVRCWGDGHDGKLGYGSGDDIGDNETPASAGAVPVGALVRISDAAEPIDVAKSATKLKVNGKPSRDKKAPFKFLLKGKVKGSFARTDTSCSGKVILKLKRGKKKVAAVKAPLTSKCTFKKKVKVKTGKLGGGKGKVKLKVQATFKGNDLLLGSKGRTKVYAR